MIRTYAQAQPARRAAHAAVPPSVAVLTAAAHAAPAAPGRQAITPAGLQQRPGAALQLQRTAGNTVVKHMLQAARIQRTPDKDLGTLKKQWESTKDPAEQNLLQNRMQAVDLVKQHAPLFGPAADEISSSILAPEQLNQGQFNFCGPNDFLMAIALRDPVAYVTYLQELYTAQAAYRQGAGGQAAPGAQAAGAPQTAHIGKLPVQALPEIVGENAAALPKGGTPVGITQTDWLSMGSLRQATTAATPMQADAEVMAIVAEFKSKGAEDALKLAAGKSDKIEQAIMVIKKGLQQQGVTIAGMAKQAKPDVKLQKVAEGAMPGEIKAWFEGYGAETVEAHADAFNANKNAQALAAANAAFTGGKAVMLNINSDALNSQAAIIDHDPLKSHWVLMQTAIVQNGGGAAPWTGKVYSWGKLMDLHIDANHIGTTFFGHVEAKVNTPQSKFDPTTIP